MYILVLDLIVHQNYLILHLFYYILHLFYFILHPFYFYSHLIYKILHLFYIILHHMDVLHPYKPRMVFIPIGLRLLFIRFCIFIHRIRKRALSRFTLTSTILLTRTIRIFCIKTKIRAMIILNTTL